MEIEERSIEGFPSYTADSTGRVWSYALGSKRPIATHISDNGHLSLFLRRDKKAVGKQVCRIVAETFLGLPPRNRTLLHIDGNKLNNNVNNLSFTRIEIQEVDEETRKRAIEGIIPAIHHIAYKLASSTKFRVETNKEMLQTLVNEGVVAAVTAYNTWDLSKGGNFLTYAHRPITWAITEYLYDYNKIRINEINSVSIEDMFTLPCNHPSPEQLAMRQEKMERLEQAVDMLTPSARDHLVYFLLDEEPKGDVTPQTRWAGKEFAIRKLKKSLAVEIQDYK